MCQESQAVWKIHMRITAHTGGQGEQGQLSRHLVGHCQCIRVHVVQAGGGNASEVPHANKGTELAVEVI